MLFSCIINHIKYYKRRKSRRKKNEEICRTLFDSNHNDWIMICHAFQYTNIFNIVDWPAVAKKEKENNNKKH